MGTLTITRKVAHKGVFDVDADLDVDLEMDEKVGAVVLQLIHDRTKKYVDDKIAAFEKLISGAEDSLAKSYKQIKALTKKGDQKSAQKLYDKSDSFYTAVEKRAEKELELIRAGAAETAEKLWGELVKKRSEYRKEQLKVIAKATLKITLAVTVIALGLAATVASHGGAAPLALASTAAAIKVTASSVSAIRDACKGITTATKELSSMITEAKMKMGNQGFLESKKDKSLKDKAKLFFKTNYVKKLDDKIASVDKAVTKCEVGLIDLGKKITSLQKKQEELQAEIYASGVGTKKQYEGLQKLENKMHDFLAEADNTNKKLDEARKKIDKAKAVIEKAQNGDFGDLSSKLLEGLPDLADYGDTLLTVGESLETIIEGFK